jgi:hypothetical protein
MHGPFPEQLSLAQFLRAQSGLNLSWTLGIGGYFSVDCLWNIQRVLHSVYHAATLEFALRNFKFFQAAPKTKKNLIQFFSFFFSGFNGSIFVFFQFFFFNLKKN